MDKLREELGQAPKATKKYTVKQAVDDWLADGLPGRAESTRISYGYALAPLVERIGQRPLRELTSSEVRIALAAVSGKLSRQTLVITRLSLERAINYARSHDRVARNVAEPVEVPEGKAGRPSKSLTLAQAQELLKAAEGERLYAYIVVSLLSGLRTEEVRALRWDHVVTWVDDATGWQPVTEVSFEGARAGQAMFAIYVWRSDRTSGETKTRKSKRSLRLPDLCVEALRKQWDQQDRDRRIAGDRWQEHALVFASAVGTVLLAGNVRRAFRSITKRAGIPGQWTPRELRHTFVSLMSESGMAVEEISHLVGHSSTTVTETVYRHELRPVIRTGADTMDKLFGSGPKSGQSSDTSPDSDPPAGSVRRRPRRTTDTTRSADSDVVVRRRKRRSTDSTRAARDSG
jgi:integrase